MKTSMEPDLKAPFEHPKWPFQVDFPKNETKKTRLEEIVIAMDEDLLHESGKEHIEGNDAGQIGEENRR